MRRPPAQHAHKPLLASLLLMVAIITLVPYTQLFRGLLRLPPQRPPPSARAAAPAAAPAPASPAPATPLSDPNPIHIVQTLCGYPVEHERDKHGLLTLKSLLMAKQNSAGQGRHYVIHLVSDVPPAALFNTTRLNWEVYRALRREEAAGRVTLRVYHTRELDAAVALATPGEGDPNLAVPNYIFKNCAAARLKLPFLLGGAVERVLYLDWDTVVVCDLTLLWDEAWPAFAPGQVLGFARADPSNASARDESRNQGLPRHPTLGAINSGVMLMHVGRLHAGGARTGALQFWRALGAIIRAKVNLTGGEADFWELQRAFTLGDQDILNALFAAPSPAEPWGRPEWLHVLPFQYNHCVDPPFPEALRREGRAALPGYEVRAPCVIHFCGNRLFIPGHTSAPWTSGWTRGTPCRGCTRTSSSGSWRSRRSRQGSTADKASYKNDRRPNI